MTTAALTTLLYYIYAIGILTSGAVIIYNVFILKKKMEPYLVALSFFLVLTLMNELAASWLRGKKEHTTNLINYFTAFEFTFYIWLLKEVVQNKKAKHFFLYPLFIYPFAALTNILFIQGKQGFHSFTYSIGCLLIVFLCIYYFFELFQKTNSVRLTKQPPFWICSALLFYYCCSFPIYGLSNLMMSLPKVILQNLGKIVILMNVFLYSMFTISYLCRIKIKKSSQS